MVEAKTKPVPAPVEEESEPVVGDILIATTRFTSTYIDDEDAAQQFKALHQGTIKPETVEQVTKSHNVGVGITYTFQAERA